jgi:hypothetical protein
MRSLSISQGTTSVMSGATSCNQGYFAYGGVRASDGTLPGEGGYNRSQDGYSTLGANAHLSRIEHYLGILLHEVIACHPIHTPIFS